MEHLIGKKLGNFEIHDLLGKGAQAVVFRARQVSVGRDVALKVLGPSPLRESDFQARFLREARTAAQLDHPNILPVIDYGEDQGFCYIAMRLAPGGSLADWMARERRLPLERIAKLVGELAGALDHAHAKGVIHRDIKPANVLLDAQGACLLADFGLAKLGESDGLRTATGTIFGTPNYMSPEQCSGGELGPRSDLYSLAVIVYELVLGVRPFVAPTPHAVALKHIQEPPKIPSTSSLTPAQQVVLLRGLAKDPAERYASGAELAAALRTALAENPTLANDSNATRPVDLELPPPLPDSVRGVKPARTGKRRVATVLGGLGALAAGAAIWGMTSFADSPLDAQTEMQAPRGAPDDAASTTAPANQPGPKPWKQFSVALGWDFSLEPLRASGAGEALDRNLFEPLAAELARCEVFDDVSRADALCATEFEAEFDGPQIARRLGGRDFAVVLSADLQQVDIERPHPLIRIEGEFGYRTQLLLRSHAVLWDRVVPLATATLTNATRTTTSGEALHALFAEQGGDFARRTALELERQAREILARGLPTRIAIVVESPTRDVEQTIVEILRHAPGLAEGSLARESDADVRPKPGKVVFPPAESSGETGTLELDLDPADHLSAWSLRLRCQPIELEAYLAEELGDELQQSAAAAEYRLSSRRWHDLTVYLLRDPSRHPAPSSNGGTTAAATGWQAAVAPENRVFPSFLLATATMEELPGFARAPNELGDPSGLMSVVITSPADDVELRVRVENELLMEPSELVTRLPKAGVTYVVKPKIRYRYGDLPSIRQTTPTDVIFDVTLGDDPTQRRVQTVTLESVNVCPFGFATADAGGQSQLLPTEWMFAAYANEDHPLIDAEILAAAKKNGVTNSFAGYQGGPEHVAEQVFAIWLELEKRGISYSSIADTATNAARTSVQAQFVRLLDESLQNEQANCVDGTVLFASVLRKIGIEPYLVFAPGHCFLAFDLDGQDHCRGLETTLLGALDPERLDPRSDAFVAKSFEAFERALEVGDKALAEALAASGTKPGYGVVSLSNARALGVLPIPYKPRE
jgi:tRNA A-37 threonylcarbamoyl transferase component Bud32